MGTVIIKHEHIKNTSCFGEMEKVYDRLYGALDNAYEEGKLTLYEIDVIKEFVDKLIKHMAKKNKYIKMEAERLMGGTVLETNADRWMKKVEEGEARGEKYGEVKGRILAYHEFGLSDEDIAFRIGKDINYVRQIIEQNDN